MSEGKQAEEQSTAETPALETKATVSPASSDRSQHCLTDGLHLIEPRGFGASV